jgi:hypothetical protein
MSCCNWEREIQFSMRLQSTCMMWTHFLFRNNLIMTVREFSRVCELMGTIILELALYLFFNLSYNRNYQMIKCIKLYVYTQWDCFSLRVSDSSGASSRLKGDTQKGSSLFFISSLHVLLWLLAAKKPQEANSVIFWQK